MMKTLTQARTTALVHLLPLLFFLLPLDSAAQELPFDSVASSLPSDETGQIRKDSADTAHESLARGSSQEEVANHETAPPFRRHWVGSSLFMLANLVPSDEPPSFFQLNYGYRLTPRDTLSVEAITWQYYAPLGIPYGPKMGAEEYNYSGKVRGYGIGLAYQRFFWKGLYAGLHVLPLRQTYSDDAGTALQRGFQLFTTLRLGYHFSFLRNRVFIEPSFAVTSWPINTNLPSSFKEQERGFSPFFVAEPGLHYGIKF